MLDVKLYAPLIVTATVGVGSWLISWAKDLDWDARRARAVDESLKRLQFWQAYMKDTDLDANDLRRAKQEIQRAADRLFNLHQGVPSGEWKSFEYAAYLSNVADLRQKFLLMELPDEASRFFRHFYLLSLLMAGLLAFRHPPEGHDEWGMELLGGVCLLGGLWLQRKGYNHIRKFAGLPGYED